MIKKKKSLDIILKKEILPIKKTNILISKIDHQLHPMYIRDFWSIRWFRFVVPNVTYVSIAQSHPRESRFFCRWHTSFIFDKFLYFSSTMNCNMASIWSMSPRNWQSTYTTLSFRPASVARNDCDLISDQHSWDDTFISLSLSLSCVFFFINIKNSK